MAKSLVIVESPAKAKTIGKYLGKNFTVKASVGHIKDLPKSKLGVDIENDFAPHYAIIPAKTKIVKELRAAAKLSDDVYLAADPDREGEAICQHLAEELGGKSKNLYRVLFHEITKNAIQDAFKKPGRINQNKVDAQQTRRILDRLVGYKISPLLWEKVRRGLSAGRVQTVAVRLIVDREQEIRAFKSEEFWNLTAKLASELPPEFTARAVNLDGAKWNITDGPTTQEIVKELSDVPFVVDRIHRREKKRYPVPAFITSKLQQEAARKLNFSVKRTMILAQRLYEGIELGSEGSVGLITYMRTDSTRVSETALQEVRDRIRRDFGESYLPHHPIYYKSRKTAQEAHEAIRPTSVERTPDSLREFFQSEPDLLKLYTLIWNRFVASQMNPAVFDQTDIFVNAGRVQFKATGSVMKFPGFLSVYQEAKPEEAPDAAEAQAEAVLPEVKEGEVLQLKELSPSQHFTQPPPRYNEASLVKALEAKGIGRPSTYATILSTIQDREYVVKQDARLYPTEIGEVVVELLVENFHEIFDYEYTARLEDHLDRIESGRERWKEAMKDFYSRFAEELQTAEKQMRDLKTEEIETNEICEKCASKMVIKWGKFGRFLACSAYPNCRNTREIPKVCSIEHSAASEEELLCEKCGKQMVLKKGRFGEFMACSGYPDCRNTKKIVKSADAVQVKTDVPLDEQCPVCGKNLAIKHGRFGEYTACSDYPDCKFIKLKSTGVACPKPGCTGEIVERKSRRGKTFYGCSRYPDCDFVLWNKPLAEPCPVCNAPFTLVKTTKRTGTIRFCNSEGCDFKQSVEESA